MKVKQKYNHYWLMKSEPSVFSIEDLRQAENQTNFWDGVRNYQARNMMRDQMKIGDLAFFYHSSCKVPGIVGVIEVIKSAYPDKTALDPNSPYFDPRHTKQNPRWFGVEVKLVKIFDKIIPLEILKKNTKLSDLALVKKGNRLSIMPVPESAWLEILNSKN